MSTETVGEWKDRKKAQAERFMKLDPSLSLDNWNDYDTTFCFEHPTGRFLIFGGLPGAPSSNHRAVDLDDAAIEAWCAPLRVKFGVAG